MSDNRDNRYNRDDRNDENQGGLFSDDYEVPKRENPYLKKNREKAKAEKAPKPEKPMREKPARVSEESSHVATADKPIRSRSADVSDEEGYTRKRTFSDWMFEHVKLVATIATILVVLSLVLITDVVGVVENLITQSQQADKEEITLTYVQGLTEKSSPVTWNDLEKFRRDESRAQDSVTWMLSVSGGQYELWISGVSIDKMPTYVYLFDMKTGDKMILGEDDFDTFIREHTKK